MADTPEDRPNDDDAPERPDDAASTAGDEGASGTTGGEVTKPAAAKPAPAPAPKAPATPEDKPYVAAAKARRKMPLWAVPVLVALPIWAIIYVNAVTKPPKHDPLTVGGQIYTESCASCHGSSGQGGGGGPALDGGDVLKTWPSYKDHITWVEGGSAGWAKTHPGATTYGGQNHTLHPGAMPAFGDSLSPGDIALVVRYEREVLSNADPTSASEKTLVACTEQALTDPTTDCTKFTGQ